MKKTVTINLNSYIYNIDEDAYELLSDYLNKLSDYFSKKKEGNEIIKDIEARIAELFTEKLSENKQVLNIEDVKEVISVMGHVEDIINSDESSSEDEDTSENKEQEKSKKKSRKLYRDPDASVISGVCAGLAAYTGLSVILWRIIFLLFIVLPGNIGIIAYLILWIAVPKAKTTAQKLEMKGEQVNLENIEKTVKEEYENIKENIKNIDSKKLSNSFENFSEAFLSAMKIVFKILAPILGVVLIIAGIVATFFMVFKFVSGTGSFVVHGVPWVNMGLMSLLEFFTEPYIAMIITIGLILLILIPIIGLIYAGVLLLFKFKSNNVFSGFLLSIWLIALISIIFSVVYVAVSYKSENDKVMIENIVSEDYEHLYFALIDTETDYDKAFNINDYRDDNGISLQFYSIAELRDFLSNYFIKTEDGNYKSLASINFTPADIENPEIEFSYYSRGRSKSVAYSNIEKISYEYNISDSLVVLSPFFFINTETWNAQNLDITVSLPYNTSFYIDKNLINLIEGLPGSDAYCLEKYSDNKWIATKDGIVMFETSIQEKNDYEETLPKD